MTPTGRTTSRLRLRRVVADDLAAFVALEAALRARETPPRDPPDPAESARYLTAFTSVWDRGELGYWAIGFRDARSGGGVVGFGGVQPKSWRGLRCWNLYYRVHPDLWGLGVATETAREAVAAAREAHPSWPVVVETRPGNAAAVAVAERVGLTPREPDGGWAVLVLDPA
ncbi:GNAT family N-acetyltransferase [Saccharothrix longispora]|uniref:RimJ/RimL family protein N-acetyltransferase n=1 Tax=Saccharothrix longispora TaxID=33920 RepID=A0ABU1PWW5_9PSEU|nr:GNAT family N-acetyltransferase [Saccharothrix longispora]MDR6595132.1 RimJ/RimL family protein N-acetyltransferase [Saccharothrix longispora]